MTHGGAVSRGKAKLPRVRNCVGDEQRILDSEVTLTDALQGVSTMLTRKVNFTFTEAVDVWLRYWSGQLQSEIAADFRINQGRVNEILKEPKHIGSKQVAASKRSA